MLTWHEIESDRDPLLAPLLDMYEHSFPVEVLAPRPAIVSACGAAKEAGGYRIAAGLAEDSIAGGAVFSLLPRSRLGFLSYIFVSGAKRRQGVGTFIYGEVMRAMQTSGAEGLLFEIEKIDLAETPIDRAERASRLRFFTRMGARVLERMNYLQPPLHAGEAPLPMHLMMHPVAPAMTPPPQVLFSWVDEVYEAVYQRGCGLDSRILAEYRSRVRMNGA